MGGLRPSRILQSHAQVGIEVLVLEPPAIRIPRESRTQCIAQGFNLRRRQAEDFCQVA
jgi:hypothetical protein